MDLKAQIEQLNEVIINLTESIETLKKELKEANRQRKAFLKLEEKAKEIIK